MNIDRSRFLSLCLALFPVAAIACGQGGDGGSAQGADLSGAPKAPAVAQSPPAGTPAASTPGTGATPAATTTGDVAIATQNLPAPTDECSAQQVEPVVSIPANKAAETAINATLSPFFATAADQCNKFDLVTSFAVTANSSGVLSILVTQKIGDGPQPDPSVASFTFDVKNGGKLLALTDVATAAGIAKQVAACVALVKSEGFGNDPNDGPQPQPLCEAATQPDPDTKTPPSWVVTKDGLQLWDVTDVAHGSVEQSTVAWADLIPDGLTSSVVLDYAKAPK